MYKCKTDSFQLCTWFRPNPGDGGPLGEKETPLGEKETPLGEKVTKVGEKANFVGEIFFIHERGAYESTGAGNLRPLLVLPGLPAAGPDWLALQVAGPRPVRTI